MGNKFTKKAQNILSGAMSAASELGHSYIGSEHILLALAEENDCIASRILFSKGITASSIRKMMVELFGIGEKTHLTPYDMTPMAKTIIEGSAEQAEKSSMSFIGTEHILLSLLSQKSSVAIKLIEALGGRLTELQKELGAVSAVCSAPYQKEKTRSRDQRDQKDDKETKDSEDSRKIKGAPTLSLYGKELCRLASDGLLDPTLGREEETERVIQILSRRTKNNPCLVGEPGVGKTAVVEGLAARIVEGKVPETLLGRRIVALDLPSMLAGSKYRGEFEERMKNVMKELTKNPDIILFIDEIHMIIGAGAAEGAIDAANIIKPALARGEMQMIGATTFTEYRAHIEKDAALERRFQSVAVDEPDESRAVDILMGLRERYEEHHGVKISDEAIHTAVKLSIRFIPDRFLPDKAIDLIDEAASRVRLRRACPPSASPYSEYTEELDGILKEKEEALSQGELDRCKELRKKELLIRENLPSAVELSNSDKAHNRSPAVTVLSEDVEQVVTQWTKIPVDRMRVDDSLSLSDMSDRIKNKIIGQDSAVDTVCGAVMRGRLGFRAVDRPIGSFIFSGSTGVGKTRLATELARELFGGEDSLIRFDMSEYMEKHTVSKLIGSPPGYVGYGEGGQLSEKVRRHPYSVVLFDEIEKAHPDVFNILLRILDDGTLTDSTGRKIDFKNTVIILTTNVIPPRSARLGFTDAKSSDEEGINNELKKLFRPEFLARIDEILVFNTPTAEDLARICSDMLTETAERVRPSGIELVFHPSLSTHLAERAEKLRNGARPLRRLITRLVEDPLSAEFISGNIASGDRISVSAEDGKVTLNKLGLTASVK